MILKTINIEDLLNQDVNKIKTFKNKANNILSINSIYPTKSKFILYVENKTKNSYLTIIDSYDNLQIPIPVGNTLIEIREDLSRFSTDKNELNLYYDFEGKIFY